MGKSVKFPQHTDDNVSSQTIRCCLPQTLFQSAFDKVHEYCDAGLPVSQKNFIHPYYNPLLQKNRHFSFMTLLIAKCLNTKDEIKQSCNLTILKMVSVFNHSISMDSIGPVNPASDGNYYIYVIIDRVNNYFAIVPTFKKQLLRCNFLNSPVDLESCSSSTSDYR